MSKLSLVSAREMEKILLSLGFRKLRQKGSHVFFAHEDGRTTIVPVHKGEMLGRGLIKKILDDIGLSVEEYETLRKKI